VISGPAARRYARALFSLADEENRVQETGQDLAGLAGGVAGLEGDPLAPGRMGLDQRRRIVAAMAAGVGAGSTVGRFLRLLAERDRLAELPAIEECYRSMEDVAEGRTRIAIRSASELTADELGAIASRFGDPAGGTVVPELEVDPDLLGGVEVEVQGRVFDGSVRTRLRRLARSMGGAG